METIKDNLNEIRPFINWASISRLYFGHTRAWLYHKLSGTDVNGNGKPSQFTVEEKEKLKHSLLDLAGRIQRAAESID